MQKSEAFTLAEVLIVIGLIGVVAVIISRILIDSSQNIENRTAAQKAFSAASNATNLIISENGMSLANTYTSASEMINMYAEKMNAIKKCNSARNDGCWAPAYTGGPSTTQSNSAGMVLSDGSFFVFLSTDPSCVSQSGNAPYACGEIYVDTNGFKNPNTVGKDILQFVVYKYGIRLAGTNNDYYQVNINGYRCPSGHNPILCQLELLK